MATEEMLAIERHVRECERFHGTRVRFLRTSPNSYRHRPAMYIEGMDRSGSRTIRMDHMPGPDGFRRDGVDARQTHVANAVENGLPTRSMLDQIDRMIAWRAFEERRLRLMRRLRLDPDDAPDWTRTAHVLMLAAHGVAGVKTAVVGPASPRLPGNGLEETSGYLHGRLEIGVGFNNVLDHRTELFVPGAVPETMRGRIVGGPLRDLVATRGSATCPPVRVVGLGGYGGTEKGPAPMLIVEVEDVRATLAPVPEGVDAMDLLPPNAVFADPGAPAWTGC